MIPDLQANDCYKILGCPRGSDPEEFKKAYRKLAIKWHPDKNPNNKEATKMFQKISEAYNILTDEERRKEYDIKSRYNNNNDNTDMRSTQDINDTLKKYIPKDGKGMSHQDVDNLYNAIFKNKVSRNSSFGGERTDNGMRFNPNQGGYPYFNDM